jgi:hypothetical protein
MDDRHKNRHPLPTADPTYLLRAGRNLTALTAAGLADCAEFSAVGAQKTVHRALLLDKHT